jgi:hypothetical protein
MRVQPTEVTVERIGAFVQIVVGQSIVRMTTDEAEQMVRAIERAIDPPLRPKHLERIH